MAMKCANSPICSPCRDDGYAIDGDVADSDLSTDQDVQNNHTQLGSILESEVAPRTAYSL